MVYCVLKPHPQKRAIEKQIQAAKARDEGRGQQAGTGMGPTELRREEGQSALLRIGLKAPTSTFVPGGGGEGSLLAPAAGSLSTPSYTAAAAATDANNAGSNGGMSKRPRISGAFGQERAGADGVGGGSGAGLKSSGNRGKAKGKRSVMEVMMEQERNKRAATKREEEEKKKAESLAAAEANGRGGGGRGVGGGGRKDYWLRVGVVVKVMNKKVSGGKYYKKKARLRKVVERYIGEVKMLDSGDRLRVDQEDLETVRPVRGT